MEQKSAVGLNMSILFIIGLAVSTAIAAAAGAGTACSTQTCIKEASSIISRMNTSVNPCDNFYEFACGRYIAELEMPEDKLSVSPFSIIGDVVSEHVRELITEPPQPNELRPIKMLKKLYSACLDIDAIENNFDRMKSIISSLGGWPIVQQNDWFEITWIELTRKLRQHGFPTSHFITVDINVNPKNSDEYIITIDQAEPDPILGDKLKEGLANTVVKTFADFIVDVAVLFGADREFATKEIHAVIEFRKKLAEISVPKFEFIRLITTANASSVARVQQQYPSIDWVDLINGALDLPNRKVTLADKALLINADYVNKLGEILKQTPKRVLANHALVDVIRAMLDYLPKRFREKSEEYTRSVLQITKSFPRWELCNIKLADFLHLAKDALYVRKFVDESARADVAEMVSYIRAALIKLLRDVEWMDNSTRQQAIEKAEAVGSRIVYPVELRDDIKIEEYYADLKFESDNLLDLVTAAAKHKRDKEVGFYGTPVVKNYWTQGLAAISVNAVYDPQANSICVPSGIIQRELYNKDRPRYMNYGALGFIVGHELTHGFDSSGKKFDKNGNALNWWAEATDNAFASKSKCFIEQYGNFTVTEINMNINGENTLGENIADNGGMKEAYSAYLEWVKQNKEEAQLPGLNYSPRQLFWISLANAWCGKDRPYVLKMLVQTDAHPPAPFRIAGSISNSREFSRDFNCPEGSNMNPKKKCQIW